MNDKNGVMNHCSRKVFKGFRAIEIGVFTILKGKVLQERHHVATVIAEMDEAAKCSMEKDGFPPNRFNVSPFTFDFPEVLLVGKSIKVERGVGVAKERKLSSNKENTVNGVKAMAFDDDDFDHSESRF